MNNTYIYIYTLYAYITFFKNCLVIVYVFIVCHSMCKMCIRMYACIIVSGICRCIVSIVYIHVQTYNYSICIHKIPICMYVMYHVTYTRIHKWVHHGTWRLHTRSANGLTGESHGFHIDPRHWGRGG